MPRMFCLFDCRNLPIFKRIGEHDVATVRPGENLLIDGDRIKLQQISKFDRNGVQVGRNRRVDEQAIGDGTGCNDAAAPIENVASAGELRLDGLRDAGCGEQALVRGDLELHNTSEPPQRSRAGSRSETAWTTRECGGIESARRPAMTSRVNLRSDWWGVLWLRITVGELCGVAGRFEAGTLQDFIPGQARLFNSFAHIFRPATADDLCPQVPEFGFMFDKLLMCASHFVGVVNALLSQDQQRGSDQPKGKDGGQKFVEHCGSARRNFQHGAFEDAIRIADDILVVLVQCAPFL